MRACEWFVWNMAVTYFEIPGISNEKPKISNKKPSISIGNLGFRSKVWNNRFFVHWIWNDRYFERITP